MSRSAGTSLLVVGDFDVEVVRRRGNKYVRLTVRPPDGRIRISAPIRTPDRYLRQTVEQHADWIHTQLAAIRLLPRPAVQRFVTGEQHLVAGERMPLVVTHRPGRTRVNLSTTEIHLEIAEDSDEETRRAAIERWYRRRLSEQLAELIDLWQPRIGRRADSWGIRRMKTLWGSCNRTRRHLTFNLELARKAPALVEYVVVHELAHLIEPGHGVAFQKLMTGHLPDWRERKKKLNSAPEQDDVHECS